jgi:hypothetical protein
MTYPRALRYSTLLRWSAVVFGIGYGALAGMCLPVSLMAGTAGIFMSESLGLIGMIFGGALLPFEAICGAILGGAIAWSVAVPRAALLREFANKHMLDQRPHDPKDADSTPLAAGIFAFVATFGLLDWAIQSTMPLVIPSALEMFFTIQLPDVSLRGLAIGLHLLSIVVGGTLSRWVFYVLTRRAYRVQSAEV